MERGIESETSDEEEMGMEAAFLSEEEMMEVWPEMDSIAACTDDSTAAESVPAHVCRDFD